MDEHPNAAADAAAIGAARLAEFTYRGETARNISFPLGGIGTGSIGLSGSGRLVDWEIFNRPNKGSVNGYSHFAVKAMDGDRVVDARILAGPIEEVSAATSTLHKMRPSLAGPKPVTIDDHTHVIARFANGVAGTITASWVTPGRKMQLEFELVGSRGSIVFTQECFNELHLFTTDQKKGRQGFKTLVAGPDTPPYGNFCPAPGHQLGFNDLKTIEVAHLIMAIAGKEKPSPDFSEAYEIQRTVAATSCGRPQRNSGVSRSTRSCQRSDAASPQAVRIQPGATQLTRTCGARLSARLLLNAMTADLVAPNSWPLQHAVLFAFMSCAVLLLLAVPAALHRYRVRTTG